MGMECSACCCATAGAHQHGAAKQRGASQMPHTSVTFASRQCRGDGHRKPMHSSALCISSAAPLLYPIPVFSIHPPHTGTSTPGLTWGCANLPTSTQPILPSQSIHPSWDQGPWLGHQLSFPASADKPLQKETEEEESLSLSPPSPYRPSLTQPGTTSERIPSKEWHR